MRDAIYQQFGAAIDSLADAIRAFPEAEWESGERWRQPWYLAFHSIFFLDLYLSESSADYEPPPPFDRGQLADGVFPERPYTKQELLDWVDRCREALRLGWNPFPGQTKRPANASSIGARWRRPSFFSTTSATSSTMSANSTS